jgi:hypothetical protein
LKNIIKDYRDYLLTWTEVEHRILEMISILGTEKAMPLLGEDITGYIREWFEEFPKTFEEWAKFYVFEPRPGVG